jgi:hypothetical protein
VHEKGVRILELLSDLPCKQMRKTCKFLGPGVKMDASHRVRQGLDLEDNILVSIVG